MKLKRVLSAVLAFTTLTLGTFSTIGSANAVEIETKDMPTPSAATAESRATDAYVAAKAAENGLCEKVEDGVILHAWCWSFNTIKEAIPQIAAAGYTAVQTSPANKCYQYSDNPTMHIMGTESTAYKKSEDYRKGEYKQLDGDYDAWWWHYQPVDYTIGNYQLGTEDEYRAMCEVAHEYGVKVITDVVSNHTAKDYTKVSDNLLAAVGINITNRPSVGSTEWLKLYHKNWNSYKTINHDTRYQTSFYNLEGKSSDSIDIGLRDLNTENKNYQAYLLDKYINQLLKDGCDGFRYDTAKHIAVKDSDNRNNTNGEPNYPNNFWQVVTGQQEVTDYDSNPVKYNSTYDNGGWTKIKENDPFIYGETLQGNSTTPFSEYSKYMSVTASTYGTYILTDLRNRNFSSNDNAILSDDFAFSSVASDKLVTWVESHDTYCNDNKSADVDDVLIRKGWAILAAREGGTPLFFSRPNGSTRENYWGNNKIGEIGNSEFENIEVKAVNHFHNAMVGEKEELKYFDGDSKILQIDRGRNGSCIINLYDDNQSRSLVGKYTNLADGTYTDTVSGRTVKVSENKFTEGFIDANMIAVIYQPSNMKLSASPINKNFYDTTNITLNLSNTSTSSGQYSVIIDGTEVKNGTFSDSDSVKLGEDLNVDESGKEIKLIISANDGTNTITKTYVYKKIKPVYVYLEKSSSLLGSSNLNAYVYLTDDNKEANWPGTAMINDSASDYCKHLIPEDFAYGKVIFNNGSSQYPTSIGLQLEGKSMLLNSSKIWTTYTPSETPDIVIDDKDTDLETYKYIYFFNSLGWTGSYSAVMSNGDKLELKESEDLHCYYVKYPVDRNYTSVTFKVGSHSITPAEISDCDAMKPGYVFVPKSETDSGEWISPNNIIEHTIYFDHLTSNFQNSVYIYLWRTFNNGNTFKNAIDPGMEMKKMVNADGTEDSYNYSYTYYYPNLSGEYDYSDYEKVKFYNNYQKSYSTVDNDIKQGEINKFKPGDKNGTTVYSMGTPTAFVDKEIPITIKYSNHLVAKANDATAAQYIEETKTTTTTATITNGDFKTAIANACNNLDMSNAYDDFVFCGSQFEYVKELASLDDNRIAEITPYQVSQQNAKNEVPYSANLNPKNFSYQNSSFSGVFADSSNFIENLNDASGNDNWVTYYSNGKEIDFNKLNPSKLPSDLSVTVYCFCKPEEYQINFHYPTTETNSTITLTNGNLCTKQNDGVIYTCYYNQLIDETGNSDGHL